MIARDQRIRLFVVSAILLVSLGASASAFACSLTTTERFTLSEEPAPDDAALPTKPELSLELIKRGLGRQDNGSSSCDDLGWVILNAEPNSKDIGYEFELVDGELPHEHFKLPSYVTDLGEDGEVWMSWIDGANDEQEAFGFTLVARPVDRWGRRGPASDPLHISHPGRSGAACSIASDGPGASPTRPGPMGLFVSMGLLAGFGLLSRSRRSSR